MRRSRTRLLAASLAVGAVLAGAGATGASAEVVYSDAYWVTLEQYAEYEFKPGDWGWSGRRGVYEHDPRYAPWDDWVWTTTIEFVYLAPDGTLGYDDWVEDDSAPNGWSYVSDGEFEGF